MSVSAWLVLFGLPVVAIVVIIALAWNWASPVEHPDREEESDDNG